eukprot:ANDGO_08480.mRNA.1 hypothetical protein H696_02430
MERTVRIMTFNVRTGSMDDGTNSWEFRSGLLLQTIAAVNPDILCVQEALRFQMDAIRQSFPQYREYGGARDDGWTGGEYSSVFYLASRFTVNEKESLTFWLSETPDVPGSRSWMSACPRICTMVNFTENLSGIPLCICNTHLDHLSAKARTEGVRMIFRQVKKHTRVPTVLTGDFNCESSEEPCLIVAKEGFSNTFAIANNGAKEGTFHAFSGRRSGDCIDFIWASNDWKVSRSWVDHTSRDGRFPSDHFPVVTELFLSRQ